MSVFDRKTGGGVVAHVSIDYLRETLYGIQIIGCVGIARLGNTSYTLPQALFQSEHCVCEATCVIANREDGHASPLSPALRQQLESLRLAPST